MITMRECFVPRPGFLFCSVDYDTFELRTWAQVCLWAVGQSRLAEVLNTGRDPHIELGASLARVSKEEGYRLVKDEAWKKEYRQPAKAGNFGFPGGMGPKKFRITARKQKIDLTLQRAYELRDAWREEWPESVLYFRWISSQTRQVLPDNHDEEIRAKVPELEHFVSKRKRGKVPYCAACNSYFQGLAADAATAAGFELAREMYCDNKSPLYGSRIVDFIHDEFLTEVPIAQAHEAAMRQAEVQCAVAQRYVPDVKITASPALMTRWYKEAKAVYENGRLVPWQP
jgi:DNA polymerase I